MTKKIEKKVIINVRNGKLWKKDFLKRLRRVHSTLTQALKPIFFA